MTRQRSARSAGVAILAFGLLLAPAAESLLLSHEYASSFDQLGRLRMLTERLAKQQLLYQLHLADQNKLQLIATVNEISESLEMLRDGRPVQGIPVPPNADIREQLDKIAEAWAPIESMATASPFDYLRRSGDFMPPRNDRGDPLHIRYFDRLADALGSQIESAISLYISECKSDGYERCDLGMASSHADIRVERLVKQAVFVYADMDAKVNRARLSKTRGELVEVILRPDEVPELVEAKTVLEDAQSPTLGSQSQLVSGLAADVRAAWKRLEREIELVDQGHAEEGNIRRALSIQSLMIGDLERLHVAVRESGVDFSVR